MLVTALAVGGLLTVRAGPARLGGALVGLGALVKGWPLLALAGTPRGRVTRRSWGALVATTAAGAAALLLLYPQALGFLRHQGGRGVQVESVGGTLLSVARLAGWPGQVVYRYGAFELHRPVHGRRGGRVPGADGRRSGVAAAVARPVAALVGRHAPPTRR